MQTSLRISPHIFNIVKLYVHLMSSYVILGHLMSYYVILCYVHFILCQSLSLMDIRADNIIPFHPTMSHIHIWNIFRIPMVLSIHPSLIGLRTGVICILHTLIVLTVTRDQTYNLFGNLITMPMHSITNRVKNLH